MEDFNLEDPMGYGITRSEYTEYLACGYAPRKFNGQESDVKISAVTINGKQYYSVCVIPVNASEMLASAWSGNVDVYQACDVTSLTINNFTDGGKRIPPSLATDTCLLCSKILEEGHPCNNEHCRFFASAKFSRDHQDFLQAIGPYLMPRLPMNVARTKEDIEQHFGRSIKVLLVLGNVNDKWDRLDIEDTSYVGTGHWDELGLVLKHSITLELSIKELMQDYNDSSKARSCVKLVYGQSRNLKFDDVILLFAPHSFTSAYTHALENGMTKMSYFVPGVCVLQQELIAKLRVKHTSTNNTWEYYYARNDDEKRVHADHVPNQF